MHTSHQHCVEVSTLTGGFRVATLPRLAYKSYIMPPEDEIYNVSQTTCAHSSNSVLFNMGISRAAGAPMFVSAAFLFAASAADMEVLMSGVISFSSSSLLAFTIAVILEMTRFLMF